MIMKGIIGNTSIKQEKKQVVHHLPPRPDTKQVFKQNSKLPKHKTDTNLTIVARPSIMRHGSYLPNSKVKMLDLSTGHNLEHAKSPGVKKIDKMMNSIQNEEIIKSQNSMMKPKTIASSSFKQSQASKDDSSSEDSSEHLPELGHIESSNEEDQSKTTNSVDKKSYLNLKTGVVDSHLVTSSQNTLLKL